MPGVEHRLAVHKASPLPTQYTIALAPEQNFLLPEQGGTELTSNEEHISPLIS